MIERIDLLEKMYEAQLKLNKRIGRDTLCDENKEEYILDLIIALEDEVAELKNCLNWKWWSKAYNDYKKYGVIDKQNAVVEMVDILHFYLSLMQTLDITPEKLYDVYMQKNKINLDRQNNNYNHLDKTEEDNKNIKI